MFEILLVSCLAATPADCRTTRVPAGEDLADCRARAREIVAERASTAIVQEFPCVPEGADRPDMAMSEVAPGVFVHKGVHGTDPDDANGGDLANIGFIVGEEAVAVIDSGTHPRIGAALLAAVRAETDLPVRWIILTHVHPDHVLGARPLTADEGSVVAHRNFEQAMALRAAGYLANLARAGMTDLTEADVVMPDQVVDGSMTIDLGGRPLTLVARATAHTNNDLTIMDEVTGTFLLGDLLFVDHVPSLDGSLKGWLAVLGELMATDAARAVPGHGPVSVAWPEGAEPLKRYLTVLADDTRSAIANGTPMLEAIRTIGTSERGNWQMFDDFNARNASAAFQELEWE